jgi:hypothetical protein
MEAGTPAVLLPPPPQPLKTMAKGITNEKMISENRRNASSAPGSGDRNGRRRTEFLKPK